MREEKITCDICKTVIVVNEPYQGYRYFDIIEREYCGKPGCLVLHSQPTREVWCDLCYNAITNGKSRKEIQVNEVQET